MSAGLDPQTAREAQQIELASCLRRHRELDTLARAAAAEAQRLSDSLRRAQEREAEHGDTTR